MHKKKLIIVGLLVFGFGVYFASLQHDSESLKQRNKLNIETQQKQLIINNKSQELEKKLQQVKAYEAQNHKKAATISPVTNTHCVSSDFVELFNQQTAEYEQILSTKHINEMHWNIAPYWKQLNVGNTKRIKWLAQYLYWLRTQA